jgi:hypothetical protein
VSASARPADNWRKRRQVFAVPHPDKTARERDIYPAFQFEDGKPIKAVQEVIEAFGGRKAPWKLALWFTSNNGLLPGSAPPVDLKKNSLTGWCMAIISSRRCGRIRHRSSSRFQNSNEMHAMQTTTRKS